MPRPEGRCLHTMNFAARSEFMDRQVNHMLERKIAGALLALVSMLSAVVFAACASQVQSQAPVTGGPTLYEGARLIVGDGSAIENAAFVVENNKFTSVGKKGE